LRAARSRLAILAIAFASLATAESARAGATAEALRALVAAGRVEGSAWPSFARDQDLLASLYEPRGYVPLWLDGARPTTAAWEAIAALREADAQGLEPADYEAELLSALAQRLADTPIAPADLARFDVALAVSFVRYVTDLHVGRVTPRALRFGFDVEPKRLDVAGLVAEAVAGDVPAAVARAEPPFLQTRLLQRQLARHRALAADESLAPPFVPKTLRPGDAFEGTLELARWLAALGDLPTDAPVPERYEGALVDAVLRFQERHGLATDGVVGPLTARALAVPMVVRAHQIELALERLRWIPALGPSRAILVNVPAFELVALDDARSGAEPALAMAVVVGRAARTETPVFMAEMTQVVFAPYWHVPRSIARGEILPKERSRPGHLASQRMEIVSGGRVLAPSAEALAMVASGAAQLRQRPGPGNALGRVKFLFPNPHAVYLHDTPAQALFARSRRDFSHGCIRVAHPAALARWVLAPEGWDAERVEQGLARTTQQVVRLAQPLPVVIHYATAVARRDGTIAFFDDLYGHDAALARVLAGGPPYRLR
jgi:L,D-transpeptidase YcbB